jgi:CheY-like chemotaxis protein
MIGIEMHLARALLPALCDPSLLENAILNLAINARDAMPGGGRLTIATANATVNQAWCQAAGSDLTPGRYIVVSVADTGIGMAPAVMERVFEPFFTTKPVGRGTGLGLSMVYGFARQSKGHIAVRSKLGQGTTFKLYLPYYDGPQPAEPEEPAEAGETPAACRSATTRTVLIVDDDDTFRTVMQEALRDLGYTTAEANDGSSALRILRSGSPIDLLITDIGLPGLDGRDLATEARRALPALPVLFITGYDDEGWADDSFMPGSRTELLGKPFTLQALEKAMQGVLRP